MSSRAARACRRLTPRVTATALIGLGLAGCQPPVTPAIPAPAPEGGASAQASATAPAAAPVPAPPAPAPAARRQATRPAAPATPRFTDTVPPALPREFRGVWVASVANIDWPSRRTLSVPEQQAELVALLDRAAALRLNAVIFQVRPAADALYASRLEPWSEYLTGHQGRAPEPFWDPLEFAVREAHARGLELHAWFNPYRARFTDATSPLHATHIARTHPELVKRYGGYLWMDPGEPAVQERTLQVVLDVVRRYDVDGVHIDDYFYPYPERDRRGRVVPFPDELSFQRYQARGGTLSRDDWRRRNVDELVQLLHEGVHAVKPWVKFGVSPFGIWRPGFPAQVRGFDAYASLYADARKWLREGWLDYLTPQLYWPTTKAEQAYPVLLDWWAGENLRGRHLWPGNFTSRAGATGAGAFPVGELLAQIDVTRRASGATGNVHFSMKSFLTNQAGLADSLAAGPYAVPAVVPATPWLQVAPPPVPRLRYEATASGGRLQLGAAGDGVWQWVVQARLDTGWVTHVLPGSATEWWPPAGAAPLALAVVALNRAGEASRQVYADVRRAEAGTDAASVGEGEADGRRRPPRRGTPSGRPGR
jgi:uncharacterized lipoprotein YddW (UPF0748 family)